MYKSTTAHSKLDPNSLPENRIIPRFLPLSLVLVPYEERCVYIYNNSILDTLYIKIGRFVWKKEANINWETLCAESSIVVS